MQKEAEDSLRQVIELASLDLDCVVVINNVIVWFKTAMMEILERIMSPWEEVPER
jgi:hypothetical protein